MKPFLMKPMRPWRAIRFVLIQNIPLLYDVFTLHLVAHDPALIHRDHASADRIDDTLVVRRENDGSAEVVDLFQYFDDIVRVDRVEVAGRLIRDQNIGLIDDGARVRPAAAPRRRAPAENSISSR